MLLNYRHVFLRIAGNRTNSVVVFFQQKIFFWKRIFQKKILLFLKTKIFL